MTAKSYILTGFESYQRPESNKNKSTSLCYTLLNTYLNTSTHTLATKHFNHVSFERRRRKEEKKSRPWIRSFRRKDELWECHIVSGQKLTGNRLAVGGNWKSGKSTASEAFLIKQAYLAFSSWQLKPPSFVFQLACLLLKQGKCFSNMHDNFKNVKVKQ